MIGSRGAIIQKHSIVTAPIGMNHRAINQNTVVQQDAPSTGPTGTAEKGEGEDQVLIY